MLLPQRERVFSQPAIAEDEVAMAVIATYAKEHSSGVESVWNEAFPDDRPWNAAATAILEKSASSSS